MITADPAMLQERAFDLCIIGSGATGIALGLEMARSGCRVLILEAGGTEVSRESQSFYDYESQGRAHGASGEARYRVYGGSTERWGGQAMHFDGADFAPREWMGSAGWPLSHAEVARYYPKAEEVMGLTKPPYDGLEATFYQTARRLGADTNALRTALKPFRLHNSVFTKTPRLRERHREALEQEPNLMVLTNAAATRLETDGNGQVRQLQVRSGEQEHEVRATHYVLATGGIENARFLLLQRDHFGVPELEAQTMIGRCFQDHPGAHVAEASGRIAALGQTVFRLQRTEAMDIKARLSWSEPTRLKDQRMAVSGTFLLDRRSSPFDASPSKQNWIGGGLLTARCLAKGMLYSPLHRTVLAVSAEDVRQRESHIALSTDAKDAFGLPRATMHWKVEPQVAESIIAYVETLEEVVRTQGLGRLRRFDCAANVETLLPVLTDNAHHIGSTSMSHGPDDGVVDADLGVHGLKNLNVVGTSVLPTGSHANPTLTALALCYRLAEQLKSRISS